MKRSNCHHCEFFKDLNACNACINGRLFIPKKIDPYEVLISSFKIANSAGADFDGDIRYRLGTIYPIKKVIFNNPATIVLWQDGTKTIVRCQDGESFDEEKGLAMAISKKALGNKGNYYDEFKKWLPDTE